MVIIAKWSTVCPCCNKRIQKGTQVIWSRDTKAKHFTCPVAAATKKVETPVTHWGAPVQGSFSENAGREEMDAANFDFEAEMEIKMEKEMDDQPW